MRRELVVFSAILAVLLALALAIRPFMLNVATTWIKNAFPGYEVTVGDVEMRNIDMISVTGIKIRTEPTLLYRIKSVDIKFSPLSLFTRTIPKVTVKNTDLQFNAPDRDFKDVIIYPALKQCKGFSVKSIAVLNLVAMARTDDWKFNVGFDGNMEIRKTPSGDTEIEGDFSSAGGKLSIRDEAFLKRLAEKTKQPFSAVEDLKDYDYTKALLHISGKPGSVLLRVILDGKKGKKDLTVPLSGF